MNRKRWTKKEDRIMIREYPKKYTGEVAEILGRSIFSVYQRAATLGIKKTEAFRKMELAKQAEKLKVVGVKSRFNKGRAPENKGKKQSEYMSRAAINRTKATRFKKGNKPHNTREKDGVITTRQNHDDGRKSKWIRISMGKWYPYHQYRWEKYRGKVPVGHCLWFKDGNTLNEKLSNLELITRAELMRRNTIHRYPLELKQTIRAFSKLKKAIHEKQN